MRTRLLLCLLLLVSAGACTSASSSPTAVEPSDAPSYDGTCGQHGSGSGC